MLAEHAVTEVASMTVNMSNQFMDQFVSPYLAKISPWALNYPCGGPEYPALFGNCEELFREQETLLRDGICKRWRKIGLKMQEVQKLQVGEVPNQLEPIHPNLQHSWEH